MAIIDDGRADSTFSRHRTERREAALLFALAYPPCLAAALLKRLGGHGSRAAGQPGRQSVLAEAKATAASVIPFAFR
jgi:hypothetical protein